MGDVTDRSCREWRERLGPWALGHGDAAERAAVESHLAGCERCREEAEGLRRVGAALAFADPDKVGLRAAPSGAVWERIEAAVRRDRRRRRGVIAGAAAVLVALLIAGAVLLRPAPSHDVTLATGGLTGNASLRSRTWGTEIQMVLTAADEALYNVWLERDDGSRVPAGSFRTAGAGRLEVTLASSLDLTEAEAIGVSTPDGETVLREEIA